MHTPPRSGGLASSTGPLAAGRPARTTPGPSRRGRSALRYRHVTRRTRTGQPPEPPSGQPSRHGQAAREAAKARGRRPGAAIRARAGPIRLSPGCRRCCCLAFAVIELSASIFTLRCTDCLLSEAGRLASPLLPSSRTTRAPPPPDPISSPAGRGGQSLAPPHTNPPISGPFRALSPEIVEKAPPGPVERFRGIAPRVAPLL